ncbi:MAG: hemerythrin [Rhodocyclaceae bacterium]|nr:MAG: hemerythrin [Rhodocyclaceae bacterium]
MNEWTPALSTGVPLLDEHHRTIFQWLAELESAAIDERTLFGVYALVRLKHYTRDHFAVEEAMMKSAGYPDLAAHKAEHDAFRTRLGDLQIKSMAEDISAETVKLLRDWLTHHIAKIDLAYVPYLKKPK